jgi:hypothetical protein
MSPKADCPRKDDWRREMKIGKPFRSARKRFGGAATTGAVLAIAGFYAVAALLTGGVVAILLQNPARSGVQVEPLAKFIIVYSLIGAALVVGAVVFIFARRDWIGVGAFLLAAIYVVAAFGDLYATAGTDKTFHKNGKTSNLPFIPARGTKISYDCFGGTKPISETDAIYVTLGVLTTAGSGSLSPQSGTCRQIASAQMVLDLGLIGFGIAGLTGGSMTWGLSKRRRGQMIC